MTVAGIFAWLAVFLSMPFVDWYLGRAYLLMGMSVGVMVQALLVIFIVAASVGVQKTVRMVVVIALIAYFSEWMGVSTGLPFGSYQYTAVMQPQLAGVPVLIPFAWLMMLPPSWAVGRLITGREGRAPVFILISALVFTAWDLFLDPQMVGWGFWRWAAAGEYFGIPLTNYLGWLLVSAVITMAVAPRGLPVFPLALVYALTWLLQTVGQGVLWGQPGPAICGFAACGFFVVLAWLFERRRVGV